jgi:hypothetical protein
VQYSWSLPARSIHPPVRWPWRCNPRHSGSSISLPLHHVSLPWFLPVERCGTKILLVHNQQVGYNEQGMIINCQHQQKQ